jgi:hypothetical protein
MGQGTREEVLMGLPTGKIVDRPLVVRVCGHQQEFLYFAVDRFREQRLAKFQQTRCAECAAKLAAENARLQPPKKGKAVSQLPPGTVVTLRREADGSWAGKLEAEGLEVETQGTANASEPGMQAVAAMLAQMWAVAKAKASL